MARPDCRLNKTKNALYCKMTALFNMLFTLVRFFHYTSEFMASISDWALLRRLLTFAWVHLGGLCNEALRWSPHSWWGTCCRRDQRWLRRGKTESFKTLRRATFYLFCLRLGLCLFYLWRFNTKGCNSKGGAVFCCYWFLSALPFAFAKRLVPLYSAIKKGAR